MKQGAGDARSRKRAGRRVREQLRVELRGFVRENLGLMARFLGLWLLLAAASTWGVAAVGATPAMAGVNFGIYLGLLPFFFLLFQGAAGLTHRSMGADAEEWTAGELAGLDKRRWTVFHDVPIGAGNVDHVAVGPGRIYAFETKWTARTDTERFLRGAAGQACRGAAALRAELLARGVDRQVIPLLVIWGPKHLIKLGDTPRLVGDARVVAGGASAGWLAKMEGAGDRLEIDWPATQAVEQIVETEGDLREGFSRQVHG